MADTPRRAFAPSSTTHPWNSVTSLSAISSATSPRWSGSRSIPARRRYSSYQQERGHLSPSFCSRQGDARTESISPTNSRFRSEGHTSELQSLMHISYAVFCLKKKKKQHIKNQQIQKTHTATK